MAGAVPIGTPDPLQKYKWYILSGAGLAMVIAAAFLLRAKPGQITATAAEEPSPLTSTLPAGVKATAYRAGLVAAATNGAPSEHPQMGGATSGTLAALKEELFQIEVERLEGKINDPEYGEQKSALEVMMKRALAREAAAKQPVDPDPAN